MDDIKITKPTTGKLSPRSHQGRGAHLRSVRTVVRPQVVSAEKSSSATRQLPNKTVKILGKAAVYRVRNSRFRLRMKQFKAFRRKHKLALRVAYALSAVLLTFTVLNEVIQPFFKQASYQISPKAQQLIGPKVDVFAGKLNYDVKSQAYIYNKDYQPAKDVAGSTLSPRFTASFKHDPTEGIEVGDPSSKTAVTLTPHARLGEPKNTDNRVVYPYIGRDALSVYTLRAASMKEDIILNKYQGDTFTTEYDLKVGDGMEARMEPNGSIGVYGVDSALLGDVSTGSEKDAQLLKEYREKAEKATLLFTIPAPFVVESGKKSDSAHAWYSLADGKDGKKLLTLRTQGLKNAHYPLTIDPSIYVETATKFMRGNNETNIDFDTSNELIQKGKTTGARFDSWTSSLALPAARWNHATAVAGGFIYVTGGNDGSSNQSTVYWAKLDTSSYAITSPNPGDTTCTSWCTLSAYNLPAARAGHTMVAYNGFLYVIGGLDGSNVRTTTVYIAKIGANGEPQLWHPTDTNKANWVYWFPSTTTLSTERSYTAAAAYNNRLYLLGGTTNGSTGGVTTVEYTTLTPLGTFGSWTTTGMVALPSARFGHSVQIYNDRVYVIGGNSSGTLQNSVSYIKLASDGTMLGGAWSTTTSFGTARMSWGGSFSTIWGNYLYVEGGCTAVNGSGYCTTIGSDVQLASINADGTLTEWDTIIGVTSSQIGYGLAAWRNTLYTVGGCTAQNTSTGACTTPVTTTQYGAIKNDGEASTVSNSVPSGTAPCSGTTPYNCDIPPEGNNAGQGGRMSGGTVINNGYVYYLGGCTAVGSGSICFTGNAGKAARNISYASINVDGTLGKPAACAAGSYYGAWCVDNTHTLNGSSGLAGFGISIFNNVIYVVGGTDGTTWQANIWRTSLASDGSLGNWSSQTYAAIGMGAYSGYQYVFARSNPGSAGTYPGNLYVLGGCGGSAAASSGLDCTAVQYTTVYKCYIKTDTSIETTGSPCTTSGQLQIDSEPGTAGSQGLGVMAGTVYANYIYLIGGQSPNETERGEVMYAKIDNSNNIVAVSGGIWQTSPNQLSPVRKRGVAFGYNGYIYALAGYNVSGGGSLNDLLYAKVSVSDGSISAFTTSQVTVNARWDLRAIVSNGYVYTMGGCTAGVPPQNCTSMTGTTQTFQLYNNVSGSPAAYTAGANLFSTDRIGASSTVMNGYIYIAGGCTGTTDCTTQSSNVQYAALSSTGSIGTWANTTGALPAARAWGQLENAGGTLYYVGGQDSSNNAQTTVYYGTPSSGDVSTWSTASNGLPAARTRIGATTWNNHIYVTGGLDGSSAVQSTVYVSPDLTAGGNIGSAWSSSTAFNVARSGTTAIAYANNLYILGGHDGTNYLNDTQFAQIASNGTIGSWTYSTSLPTGIRDGDGFAANGYMYLIGGRSADTTCDSNTLVAPISANTTIASGNTPTGLGDWYETNVKYSGNRYGAAVAYNEGKAYILGGGCGATLTYTGANRIAQTTMMSQPMLSKYSLMIDTDSDVTPTKWLMNGLDNSTGAEWYLRYRSSTATNAAWGQETNYGIVPLGTPTVFNPLDGSGTNTSVARYYYFNVTIDSSQAFGYPEDVTRGPTIADLSLFFTADPSKRLRHGATFTGGVMQPLDTPF